MYSIVEIKGKQYKVEEGKEVEVDFLDLEKDSALEDYKVLLHQGEETLVGTPYLENVKIEAKVVEDTKGEKLRVVHYKPKTNYRKVNGHRQKYTKLKVNKISVS